MMGRLFRNVMRDDRGTVAVEFVAIALPLLLLLTGTIEISRYIWTRQGLQEAALTGARCIGLRVAPCFSDDTIDPSGAVSFVRAQASGWALRIPSEAVTAELTGSCGDAGDFARVGIAHSYTSVVPVISGLSLDVEACFPVMPSQ